MPFCLQSCCDACKFFLTYFPLEKGKGFFFLPVIDTRKYLSMRIPQENQESRVRGAETSLATLKRNRKSLGPSLLCSRSSVSVGSWAVSATGKCTNESQPWVHQIFIPYHSPLSCGKSQTSPRSAEELVILLQRVCYLYFPKDPSYGPDVALGCMKCFRHSTPSQLR